MREVVLFIAMSLDGYIADEQGGVEWLRGQDPGAADPDSYADFIRDVDLRATLSPIAACLRHQGGYLPPRIPASW